MENYNTALQTETNFSNALTKSDSDNVAQPTPSLLSLESSAVGSPQKLKVGHRLSDLVLNDVSVDYVAGMFPRGKVSALIGESGKGKSWVLPAAALTITAGKEFLPTDNYDLKSDRKVLIVDTEGRITAYAGRIQALGGTLENFIVPALASRILGFNSTDRKLIESVIEENQPDFVIFDSFAGFSEVDENSYAVVPCLKWFIEIAAKYCVAVTFTQLANKSELKDGRLTMKSIRGFSGIPQFPEIIWAIDTPDNSDERKKRIYQIKNNIEQKDNDDYIFTLDQSVITFTGEKIEDRKTKKAKRLEVLKANPNASDSEVAQLIREQHEPDAKLNSLAQWVRRERK
ncbi:AAA family ATPase [Leptolyngbya sp. AN03gr2]|uniref:AAA family ATPase n=1 Tax=unclassified Leptolyngbya TaxID=2650499 RepID=UPI003D3185D5